MAIEKPTWIYKSKGDKQTASEMNQLAQSVIINATELSNIKDDVAELSNKTYNPEEYSGMGRAILRKNIVNGVNVLTQEMIDQENTIYIIQYDYNLNNQTITIPDGCILQFEGGSLNNGTLISIWLNIKSARIRIFNNIKISSNSAILCPEWFGAIKNIPFNNSPIFNYITGLEITQLTISLDNGEYNINDNITINKSISIIGKGLKSILKCTNDLVIGTQNLTEGNYEFNNFVIYGRGYLVGIRLEVNPLEDTYNHIENIIIKNISILGARTKEECLNPYADREINNIFIKRNSFSTIENIIIDNVICDGSPGRGMYQGDNIEISSYADRGVAEQCYCRNILINNCILKNAGRQNISLSGLEGDLIGEDNILQVDRVLISNCILENSSLAGVDLEVAGKVSITNCQFLNNGNYKGFYNNNHIAELSPDTVMRSGVSLHVNSYTQIANCIFTNNFYGIGGTSVIPVSISNCKFIKSQIHYGDLARGADFIISNCYFRESNLIAYNNTFTTDNCIIENATINVGCSHTYAITSFSNCSMKDIILIGNTVTIAISDSSINNINFPELGYYTDFIIRNCVCSNLSPIIEGYFKLRKLELTNNIINLESPLIKTYKTASVTISNNTFNISKDITAIDLLEPPASSIIQNNIFNSDEAFNNPIITISSKNTDIIPDNKYYFFNNILNNVSTFIDIIAYNGLWNNFKVKFELGFCIDKINKQDDNCFLIGQTFYSELSQRYIMWNGTSWVNLDGTPLT